MKSNLIKAVFKKPEPQSKLNGKLGLTVQDIADSLGIEAYHVRQKLTSRGMLDRLKVLNLKAITIAMTNPTNGTEYTDYVLDVNAAKFFIAKYENAVGDAYLKYLVEVESDAQAEGVTSHIDPTGIAKMMGNPEFIIEIANKWKEALTRAEKAEAEIITNKENAVSVTIKECKPMAVWMKEYPILNEKAKELTKTCKNPRMFPAGLLTAWIDKHFVIDRVYTFTRKRKPVNQYDKATILKAVELLEKDLTC